MAKLEDLIARDTRSNQPTAGVAGRLYFVDDENVLERDTGSAWEPFMAADQSICNGRLTLESGVPISTTDQTAKTTVYFTPFRGNKIALYDGSGSWSVLKFAEKSLSLSGYTANKNYDIWAYNNSGTVALDSTIWTDDTTRATALASQDGIYVKTGATTRRYLGTIRINSTGGQCEDTLLCRFVWNYHNPARRKLYNALANHTYTGGWRSWNNDTGERVEVVIGLQERLLNMFISATLGSANNTTGWSVAIGLALDATNTTHSYPSATYGNNSNIWGIFTAQYLDSPVAGYHYLQATEMNSHSSANGFNMANMNGAILA